MDEELSVEGRYQVVFTGLPVSGTHIMHVRKNFEDKFKLPATRLDSIFHGGQALLQKNLDWSSASKYSAVMKEMGALCEIVRGKVDITENIGLAPCPKCNSLQIADVCSECGFDIKNYKSQMATKGFISVPGSGYMKNRRDAPRRLSEDRRDDIRYEDERRLDRDRRKNGTNWYSD